MTEMGTEPNPELKFEGEPDSEPDPESLDPVSESIFLTTPIYDTSNSSSAIKFDFDQNYTETIRYLL